MGEETMCKQVVKQPNVNHRRPLKPTPYLSNPRLEHTPPVYERLEVKPLGHHPIPPTRDLQFTPWEIAKLLSLTWVFYTPEWYVAVISLRVAQASLLWTYSSVVTIWTGVSLSRLEHTSRLSKITDKLLAASVCPIPSWFRNWFPVLFLEWLLLFILVAMGLAYDSTQRFCYIIAWSSLLNIRQANFLAEMDCLFWHKTVWWPQKHPPTVSFHHISKLYLAFNADDTSGIWTWCRYVFFETPGLCDCLCQRGRGRFSFRPIVRKWAILASI